MIVIYILSWSFTAFVLCGFVYLLLQWILAKDGNYVFEKREKPLLIFKRTLFITSLIVGFVFLISSFNTKPYSIPIDSDYTPGQELPWK